jgi:tRNA modification GTPase
MNNMNVDTICALATPPGVSAIAMVRLSGPEAFSIADKVFVAKDGGGALGERPTNTIHYGNIIENDTAIDEVMASIFRNPHSYTGEDTIEISCHGSPYIQDQLLQVLIRAGATMAKPGEFTQRAFLNGKMDLSRAEAVADLIESNSASSHRLAMQHIKGGFAKDIQALREQLVNFASLIELELDFSEEDVEFANRDELTALLNKISTSLEALADSFSIGNVIRNGVPVTIA